MNSQEYTLKSFQLRAARITADIELKTIGDLIGLTKACISRWEHQDSFYKLKTSRANILTIKELFAKHDIFFPDEHSIAIKTDLKNNELQQEGLTRFQLRAARVILNMTQERLASLFNISRSLIKRAEFLKNHQYIRPADEGITIKLKSFLESKNFVFQDNLTISFFSEKMH